MATHIELLAAVLAGSYNDHVYALNTELYPILHEEAKPITGSATVEDIRELIVSLDTPIVSGDVSVEEITIDTVLIEYAEEEKEITGDVSVLSIDVDVVLVSHTESENEIEGSVLIESIDQAVVLVPYTESENEIEGSVLIDEITKV